MIRSFSAAEFPAERLAEAKRGRAITVCLPARDEEATVGQVVSSIRTELMDRIGLVDELLVIDDGSSDRTAAVAEDAGAHVLGASAILPEYGTEGGKGQALWRAVHVARGDLLVFCDADIRNFDPGFVLGLVGPLLTHDDVQFVKGFYERPLDGRPGEGGRVTELMARPVISLLFPHLAPLFQPLSGECAAWREVLEQVPFVGGYGVDLGLLIDVSERFGASAIVQSDLGERVHRNRPLVELSSQALAILQLALSRANLAEPGQWAAALLRPGAEPSPVTLVERPPLAEVPAHRKSA
ncbi:MAG: glucosyl-3-phosphoglycerate synthase [Acidimicrobiaceae bacterium]|nr:glucosyl-3-phosphoglycerate synthase [Acidimicrobiaceae bacterium]